MNFSEALNALLGGSLIRNRGWNHERSYIGLQSPDENSKMTEPYIYFNKPCDVTAGGFVRIPWVASQFDILRGDWEIVQVQQQSEAA